MKATQKRLISLLLAVVLTLSCLAMTSCNLLSLIVDAPNDGGTGGGEGAEAKAEAEIRAAATSTSRAAITTI